MFPGKSELCVDSAVSYIQITNEYFPEQYDFVKQSKNTFLTPELAPAVTKKIDCRSTKLVAEMDKKLYIFFEFENVVFSEWPFIKLWLFAHLRVIFLCLCVSYFYELKSLFTRISYLITPNQSVRSANVIGRVRAI